jgi:hypothetical protein
LVFEAGVEGSIPSIIYFAVNPVLTTEAGGSGTCPKKSVEDGSFKAKPPVRDIFTRLVGATFFTASKVG